MVTFTVRLEVPDWEQATALMEAIEEQCEQHEDWKIDSFRADESVLQCPECGKPMEFNDDLQAYACPHDE